MEVRTGHQAAAKLLTALVARAGKVRVWGGGGRDATMVLHSLCSLEMPSPGLDRCLLREAATMDVPSAVAAVHNLFHRSRAVLSLKARNDALVALQKHLVEHADDMNVKQYALVIQAVACCPSECRVPELRRQLLGRLHAVAKFIGCPKDMIAITVCAARVAAADPRVYTALAGAFQTLSPPATNDDITTMLKELQNVQGKEAVVAAAIPLLRVLTAEAERRSARTRHSSSLLASAWCAAVDDECRMALLGMIRHAVRLERLARAHPRVQVKFICAIADVANALGSVGDVQNAAASASLLNTHIAFLLDSYATEETRCLTAEPELSADALGRLVVVMSHVPQHASAGAVDALLNVLVALVPAAFAPYATAIDMIERQPAAYLARYLRIADGLEAAIPTATVQQLMSAHVAIVGALFPVQQTKRRQDGVVRLTALARALQRAVLTQKMDQTIPTATVVRFLRAISKMGERSKSALMGIAGILSKRVLTRAQAQMALRAVVKHHITHKALVDNSVATLLGDGGKETAGVEGEALTFSESAIVMAALSVVAVPLSHTRGVRLLACCRGSTLDGPNAVAARHLEDAVHLFSGIVLTGATAAPGGVRATSALSAFLLGNLEKITSPHLLSTFATHLAIRGLPAPPAEAHTACKRVLSQLAWAFNESRSFGDLASALLWLPCLIAGHSRDEDITDAVAQLRAVAERRIASVAQSTTRRNTFSLIHLAMCRRVGVPADNAALLHLVTVAAIEEAPNAQLPFAAAMVRYFPAADRVEVLLDMLEFRLKQLGLAELVLILHDLFQLLEKMTSETAPENLEGHGGALRVGSIVSSLTDEVAARLISGGSSASVRHHPDSALLGPLLERGLWQLLTETLQQHESRFSSSSVTQEQQAITILHSCRCAMQKILTLHAHVDGCGGSPQLCNTLNH